jgi:hypothetical protein
LKYYPELTRETARQELDIVKELVLVKDVLEKGMGYISKEKATFTRDVMSEAYNLTVEVPVEDLYTLDFLPK